MLTLPINAWQSQGGVIAAIRRASRFPFQAFFSAQTEVSHHSRSERASAAALVVLLHGVAIALALFSRSGRAMVATPGLVAINIHDIAPEPQRQISQPHQSRTALAAAPVPPVQLASIDPVDSAIQPAAQTIPAAQAQVIPAALSGGCDLTQPVQDALRNDDAVRRQLPAIPRDLRSVANAIVVWNAGWTPVAAPAQAALAAIRQTITQTVTASSPECRNQLQRGPRLLFLPSADGRANAAGSMTVLALGSGQWTWQQLVDGGQPLSASTLAVADAPPAAFAAGPAATVPGQNTPQSPALGALLASLIRQRSPTASPYYP